MKIDRTLVYNKYGGHCAYCGKEITIKEMQVDHIYPKSRGGLDSHVNLAPSCHPCNIRKGNLTIEEFRRELKRDLFQLERDSAKFRLLKSFGKILIQNTDIVFYFEINKL